MSRSPAADRPPGRGGQPPKRRYARIASGAKTAVSSTGQPIANHVEFSASALPSFQPGLPNNSRVADAVADNGFQAAIAPSQPGMVAGSTNRFESMLIGQTRICTAPTDSGPLATKPMKIPIQS